MLLSLLFVLAAETAAAAPAPIEEPDPKGMSRKEITAFNARLARSHPFYIRCVRSVESGSLVRKSYSCRTNAQWRAAHDIGNDNARDSYDAMKGKAVNSSG